MWHTATACPYTHPHTCLHTRLYTPRRGMYHGLSTRVRACGVPRPIIISLKNLTFERGPYLNGWNTCHIVMVYIAMAYTVMPDKIMAYIVMPDKVMVNIVMACTVMAFKRGPYFNGWNTCSSRCMDVCIGTCIRCV